MFAKDYRELARENLRGNWKQAILAGMIAFLLGGVGYAFFPELDLQSNNATIQNGRDLLSFAIANYSIILTAVSLLCLLQFVIGGVIQIGYASYLLKQHDRQEPQINDLFSKFDFFAAGFAQAFLRNLYIFLWSLLFIIPGIVASYSYAMTPYIMAEHPEMTASEAIRASKTMMKDNKWALFCLDFSFWGWSFLCGLTLNIGYIFLNPYKNAAHAAFYRRVSVSDPFNEEFE